MKVKRRFYTFILKISACVMVIQGMLLFQLTQPYTPGYQTQGFKGPGEAFSFFGPANVEAAQPIADAGDDGAATKDQPLAGTICLDGGDSSDPDADSLAYPWYGPFETAGVLAPTVVVPEGTYTVSLAVDDG